MCNTLNILLRNDIRLFGGQMTLKYSSVTLQHMKKHTITSNKIEALSFVACASFIPAFTDKRLTPQVQNICVTANANSDKLLQDMLILSIGQSASASSENSKIWYFFLVKKNINFNHVLNSN